MTPSKKQLTEISPSVEKELQHETSTSTEEETFSEEQVSMEKENNNRSTKSKPSPPAASAASSSAVGKVKKSITPEKQVQQEEEEEDNHDKEIEETSKPEPSKRPGTATDEKKSSRSPNKLFKRFWNEEDELVILKEMAYFSSKKGKDPFIYCESFLSFVKDKLQVNPTTAQLKDKMYRLKKRFKTNSHRHIISNPHEKKVFQLSKKVWEVDNIQQDENPNTNLKPKLETDMQGRHEVIVLKESRDHDRNLFFLEMSKVLNEYELKRGLRFLGKSKRKKLEEEWMDLHDEENDLAVKRTRITAKHVEVIVEALKLSRS